MKPNNRISLDSVFARHNQEQTKIKIFPLENIAKNTKIQVLSHLYLER